jgi:hypothetical protein
MYRRHLIPQAAVEFMGKMESIRKVLSGVLIASSVIGAWILITDKWLWIAEPTHAYGLAAFIGFGGVLAVGLWRKTRLAVLGAMLLAVVQFTAMISDMIIGQPASVPADVFRSYLLNDVWFLTLVITQIVILALAVRAAKV